LDIKRLVRPSVRDLRAYEAKETPARVKLDANESPFGCPAVKGLAANRYPDPEARALKAALARRLRVRASNILAGNGSDELIYYLITTFGGPVMYPTPTFSMYGIIAQALGQERVEVPLDGAFDLREGEMLREARARRAKLIFLSSPNNPTGNCFSPERITRLIEGSGAVVVVDEAYQPFSGRGSFLRLLGKHENLLVMRTLSKVGLAALRVGFLIGGEAALSEVNKVRLPFNLNAMSQALARRALEDPAWMRSAVKAIVSERKRLLVEMSAVPGIEAYPSDANFVLFRAPEPRRLHAELLKRGVLVRDLSGAVPGCLRVTVGSEKENEAFMRALRAALRAAGAGGV